MAVFIETRTDPFVERRERMKNSILEGGRNTVPVRRPLRGIEIKQDTHAVIRVALQNGEFLGVLDQAGEILNSPDGKSYTTQYTNFLIQSVVEERQEKQQIVETFGDAYIFFFGESPRMLQVSGLLLNTADFNWRNEWWENYERYFRGTRCVEHGARIYLIYDDVIIEGYILGAQATENAQQPFVIPLQFNMFVTGYTSVSLVGSPNYPVPAGKIDYTQPVSHEELLRQWDNGNIQREVSIDAVRAAARKRYRQAKLQRAVEGFLGEGRLLAQAIRGGLESGDPSITGFMQRSRGAIFGMDINIGISIGGRTTDDRGLRPNPFLEGGRVLRSTFRDNTDEFLGQDVPSASDMASPLSMAERWLQMDRAIDNSLYFYIDTVGTPFSDIMGRIGRADFEIGRRQSPYQRNNGVFQTGSTRQLRAGRLRDIPFGIGAFSEVGS